MKENKSNFLFNRLVVLSLLSIFLVLGCVQTPFNDSNQSIDQLDSNSMKKTDDLDVNNIDKNMVEDNTLTPTDDNVSDQNNDNNTVENTGTIRYSEEVFNQKLSEGKIVVLSFYANWCPTCRQNQSFIEEGAQLLDASKYVVLTVHYKDDESKPEDDMIIQRYNIVGQHTFVVVGSQGKELGRSRQDFTNGLFNQWVTSVA